MNPLQNIAQFNKRFVLGELILVLALLFVIPVDLRLAKTPNTLDRQYIQENFILPLYAFQPEQAERAQFLFTVVALPVLILLFGLLNNKWQFLRFLTVRDQNLMVYVSALILVILGCLDFRMYAYYYFISTPFAVSPFLAFGLSIVFIIATVYFTKWLNPSADSHRYRLVNFVYILLAIILVGIVLSALLARKGNLATKYYFDGSFDAFYYSIVQVFQGKTILVDLNSQYGLYPYFLLPLLKLIGLNITAISLIQIFFYLVFCVTFLLILEKFVKNPWVKLFCLLTFIYLVHILGFIHSEYQYYYQYVPHRLIFPALILLVCFFYYRDDRAKRLLYIFGFLISSIALLWNLDTGIPVLGVWLLSLFV